MSRIKGNRALIWLVIITVLGGYFLLIYLFMDTNKFKWNETYNPLGEQPYDCKLVSEYLKKQSEREILYSDSGFHVSLSPYFDSSEANYFNQSSEVYLDSTDLQNLFVFVESGNNAFFFNQDIDERILERLNNEECVYYLNDLIKYETDSLVVANFINENLKTEEGFSFKYKHQRNILRRPWFYIDSDCFCDSNTSLTPLGYFNDSLVNFIRAPYGSGYFYFHTNPVLITNYFFADFTGIEYGNKVLAHLNNGNVIWENRTNLNLTGPLKKNYGSNEGPFKYIFSQDSLKWAFYVSLVGLLLYALYGMKRKQRIIPIASDRSNSSIEYVETISELYFRQKGAGRIAQYMTNQYFDFIKNHYRITSNVHDQKWIEKLAMRSGNSIELINNLIEESNRLKIKKEISNEDLVNYQLLLSRFYKKLNQASSRLHS